MRRRRGDDDGFTLVEVITGMAVITVVLAGVTMFFIQSMKVVDLQGQRQTAVQVAADQMEELRSQAGPPDIANNDGAYRWLNANQTSTTTRNGLTYTVVWVCTDASSGVPCTGPPGGTEATWTKVLQAQITVTFQSNSCPAAGCAFSLKTQISTSKNNPIF
jgi:prepilin-type N-terminal cleavage/methylation domain-containing protein